MQYSIQIPKPCHESWEEMTPADTGKHCASCCKTVVDFTNWQQEDILRYLQEQGSTKTCGRFRNEQVNTPISADQYVISVARSSLPLYRKIAAILLLAFGMIQMGCDADNHTKNVGLPAIVAPDTTKHERTMLGEAACPPVSSRKPDTVMVHKKVAGTQPPEREIMGDMVLEEIPPPPQIMGGAIAYPMEESSDADTTDKKQ